MNILSINFMPDKFIIDQLIMSVIGTIVSVIILKLLFKKSILSKVGVILTVLVILLSAHIRISSEGYYGKAVALSITIGLTYIALHLINKLIKKPLEEVIRKIEQVADGNLDVEIQEIIGENEIERLNYSVFKLVNFYGKAMISLRTGIDNLLSSSSQLNHISHDVTDRASSQAAASEELSTSMNAVLTSMNESSVMVEKTGQISRASAQKTEDSNTVLQKTINSINAISEKITVISDIANKTDILSINAAIEAAAAGEAGKGFAVVAQEIQKLSNKVKDASEEINNLSQQGQEISRQAGEKLAEIIPEILENTKLVNDIVISSKKQQQGIETINSSIQHLNNIANENVATAEEMLDAAEKLSKQAQSQKELLSFIK